MTKLHDLVILFKSRCASSHFALAVVALLLRVAGRITRRNAPEIATKVLQGAARRAGIQVIAQHQNHVGTYGRRIAEIAMAKAVRV